VVGQRRVVGKVLARFDTVKLTTTGQFIVVLKINGLSSLDRLFNLFLNLVGIHSSVLEPALLLILFLLAANALFLGRVSAHVCLLFGVRFFFRLCNS